MTIKQAKEKQAFLNEIIRRKKVKEVEGGADDGENIAWDKLNHAISKSMKRIERSLQPHIDEFNEVETVPYNDKVDNFRSRYAAVYPEDFKDEEKRGLFVTNEQGATFLTPANLIKYNSEWIPLRDAYNRKQIDWMNKEIEIAGEDYFADIAWPRVKEVPLINIEELEGLLFEPGTLNKLMK